MLYLIRHAKTEKTERGITRHERRLSGDGRRQAAELVESFRGRPVARVLCSPARRCLETVAPLCDDRGIRVEVDKRLREGASLPKCLELVAELADSHSVLCSHGDLIPAILADLEARGLVLDGALRAETGGVWSLEGQPPARASYFRPAARDAQRERRLAVLDLGSTSFHLLVADVSPSGTLVPVERERIMLRLGAAIVSDGLIPDTVLKRVVRAASALGKAAYNAGAEALLPIATSAVRDASNRDVVAKRLAKALGTAVRILSGSEEAALTFRAMGRRGALGPGTSLAIDLGGGSLELALGDSDRLLWETTLRLGVARLRRELSPNDPPNAVEVLAISDRVRDELRPHAQRVREAEPVRFVASGGTVRAVARRARARRSTEKDEPEVRLSLEELRAVRDELLGLPRAERQRLPGVQRRRADLLPAGCVILATLSEMLEIEELRVSDWGLREGVLLEAVDPG